MTLRAPFALDRFFRDPDGRVGYRLPKPWPTPQGRTELHLEPHAFTPCSAASSRSCRRRTSTSVQ